MEVKYACSLGPTCQSSQILKDNNFKKCSYPFDWIFSDFNIILHCIEDNFKIFLDKTYYFEISKNRCGHKYYCQKLFWHHNPLNSNESYNYYLRCVNRFRELLKINEHKLFIMIFSNNNEINSNLYEEVNNFNEKFSNYTNNYRLLTIFHIPDKQNNYHKFTHKDNIDFLELHTLSKSNGLNFENKNDNDYLNKIITTQYLLV